MSPGIVGAANFGRGGMLEGCISNRTIDPDSVQCLPQRMNVVFAAMTSPPAAGGRKQMTAPWGAERAAVVPDLPAEIPAPRHARASRRLTRGLDAWRSAAADPQSALQRYP